DMLARDAHEAVAIVALRDDFFDGLATLAAIFHGASISVLAAADTG
ncbi:MAG: hypothetical protein ACI831_001659, partial [Candidatus Azotimanducaceae bacterium]